MTSLPLTAPWRLRAVSLWTDKDGNMPKSDIERRLAQVVSIMKDVNSKLAEINSQWADPPDPDKPAIRATLNDVKTQAASSTRLADGMLARLG